MLKKHRHQFEGLKKEKHLENGNNGHNMSKLPIIRSLADIGKSHSSSKSKFSLHRSSDYKSHLGATMLKSRIKLKMSPPPTNFIKYSFICYQDELFCYF